MSILHTVNKSPFEKNSLDTCLRLAKKGSAILLYEDAVYGAVAGHAHSRRLAAASQTYAIYVLEADLKARGVADKKLAEGIRKIDYAGFVELVCEHSATQCWL